MNFLRRLVVMLVVASFALSGAAAARVVHAHDLAGGETGAAHAGAAQSRTEHHAAAHLHGHEHGHEPVQEIPVSEILGGEHDADIPHSHGWGLVALEAVYAGLERSARVQVIELVALVVTMGTRSVVPADRPPRSFA